MSESTLRPDCIGQCNGGMCPYRIPCWRKAEYDAGMDRVDTLDDEQDDDAQAQ